MFYLKYGLALLVLMLAYVWIARHYKIVDTPNQRSSHSIPVVRGAGVVFPLSLIVYKITFSQYYPNFIFVFVGAMLISLVSFLDDVKSLPVYVRFPIHILSVLMFMYGFDVFAHWPWWVSFGLIVIMLGIINAFNFMDGINGITALYSLVAFSSFWYVIKYVKEMESTAFVNYGIVTCIVFLFFNFRKRAVCFLGDVGALSLGFWIVAALGYVMFWKEPVFEYILFLAVYGIDTGYTILQRLFQKENIFRAHRKHLYQKLVNEGGMSHLLVSTLYAALQLLVNVVVVFTDWNIIVTSLVIILPLSVLYFSIKYRYIKMAAYANQSIPQQ